MGNSKIAQKKLPAEWQSVELSKLLSYEQPTNYIVETENYDDKYKTPVLTAGKSFLLGYTDETDGIFPVDKLPVIIFDDFTTATQFVDFPFKVKSSAMKILLPKCGVNIKFVFDMIQNIEFDTSQHKRYWISRYSKCKIPLPPLAEQERIVALLNEQLATVKRAEQAAKEQLEATRTLPTAYLREVFPALDEDLPNGWEWKCLGDIADVNPKRPKNLVYAGNTVTTFIPMPSVNAAMGTIDTPLVRNFGEIIKGYTYFEDNDVIFAKITPCMQNGKHAIAKNLINGFAFGSTEFHVLRAKNNILPEWIHYYVRQKHILECAQKHFTGSAGQKRLPKCFLEKLQIPLPPLAKQKRIVAKLDERLAAVKRAEQATKEQLATIRTLKRSLLWRAFKGAV